MQVFADMARGQLQALTANTISISSAEGATFPVADRGSDDDLAGNTWFKVVLMRGNEFEVCHVHQHSGNGLMTSVLRAQDGTDAKDWPLVETKVFCTPVASDSAKFEALRFVENGIPCVSYGARADLRTQEKGVRMVESLGLFLWFAGSDEPDDDESCFATASGAWLLECPSWDVVNDWQIPDAAVIDERLDDAEKRISAAEDALGGSKVLTGTVASSITSVSYAAQVSFAANVKGASVGDIAIATPPNSLVPRVFHFAVVTAADTVTIYLNNPSDTGQAINPGVWSLAVITKK